MISLLFLCLKNSSKFERLEFSGKLQVVSATLLDLGLLCFVGVLEVVYFSRVELVGDLLLEHEE